MSQKQKHDYIVADFNHPDLLEKKINDYIHDGNKAEILINNTGGPPQEKLLKLKKKNLINIFQCIFIAVTFLLKHYLH